MRVRLPNTAPAVELGLGLGVRVRVRVRVRPPGTAPAVGLGLGLGRPAQYHLLHMLHCVPEQKPALPG